MLSLRLRLRRALGQVAVGLWLWTAAGPALAIEPFATDETVQFKSDELTYDSTNKITEATGNVEAVQRGRRLLADRIIYDELQDKMTAIGNVTLYEPTGEVISAKSMELTGDLKNGVVEDLHAVLADGARLSAASGERKDGIITTAHDATYTACFPCADDPSRAPLWQLRAVKVKENQEEKIIEFSHAWLEFRGIPFAYFPYLSQPDPSVKRKTGFLIPGFGQSSDLGFIIQAPYYVVISDSQDMTITPWITTNEGPVLEGEYRQALQHGKIDFGGSATVDSNQKFLGHVRGQARYDFDEDWRGGLDVDRASGRTYLRRYNFNYSRSLTSRLFAEDFIGSKNYFVGNAIAFENLDDDVKQRTVPYVAPWLDYFYVSDPDRLGGTTNVRLDTATLTRQEGTDSRRLSARAAVGAPVRRARSAISLPSRPRCGPTATTSTTRRRRIARTPTAASAAASSRRPVRTGACRSSATARRCSRSSSRPPR